MTEQSVLSSPASAPPRRSRARRAAWWTSVALVLAGSVLLGYVAWQLWGTNYVSRQKQQQAVQEIEKAWRADPRTGSDGTSGPTDGATALVRIPRFGDDFVMPVFEGTGDEALSSGLGHFDDSAPPGRVGNFALAGHRVTHGEPLRDMPSLRPGDRVVVETRRTRFVYQLDTDPNDLVVPFTAGWVVDPHPVNPDPAGVGPAQGRTRLLTLTTCSELFHTDDRLVAFGHLVSAERVDRS